MGQTVVVGGGVVGLCAAWALVKRGVAVTVVDPGPTERSASFGNAGWIVPSLAGPVPAPGLVGQSLRWMLRPGSPLHVRPRLDPAFLRWLVGFWRHCDARAYRAGFEATAALGAGTMACFDALRADGVAFEEHRDGLLFVYRSETELVHDHAGLEPLRRFGYDLPPLLDGAALREREPALAADLAGGYWLAAERSVHPASLVAGLEAWLRARGVAFVSAAATGFGVDGDRVTAVETGRGRVGAGPPGVPGEATPAEEVAATSGRIAAEAVVVAAGAWTPAVLRHLGVRLPIEAGKGYHLDYAPAPPLPHPPRTPLYLHEARVAVTPLDGMVRLAGTMELSGLDDRIRPERVAALPRAAAAYLPGWPIGIDGRRAWTGPRPMTPDGLPAIGLVGRWRNVAVAGGHAMLGLTLAPATGEAIAELLLTGRAPEVVAPFDPARFG